jgi:L-2-hydroxyglutarate oxidase
VKATGIVDYRQVCIRMALRFQEMGGEVRLNVRVTDLVKNSDSIVVTTVERESIETRYLIACAGLMADRVTEMLGIDTDFRIIPYRSEYFRLPPAKNDIVKHLIYPIPDPDLPFLGAHLTRMINDFVTVGPIVCRAGSARVAGLLISAHAVCTSATFAIPIGEYICDKVADVQNPASAARG